MLNVLLVFLIIVIVGGSLIYIITQKKKGKHCIGCPYSDTCKGYGCNNKSSL